MLTNRLIRTVALAAVASVAPATASAAPRLTNVSQPAPVTGVISAGAVFPICGPTAPVPITFTASERGSVLVTGLQTSPATISSLLPRFASAPMRPGTNTFDLTSVPAVGGLSGTDRGPVRVTNAVTLVPVNARWQVGPAVRRSVSVICT